MRVLILLLLSAVLLFGETFKLYLKDGGSHMVREYKRDGDRITYYSTDRGEWEEIPVELVDLDKTEAERKAKAQAEAQESHLISEEEKAERELRKEVASIPEEPGAYFMRGKTVEKLSLADYQVITSKKRQALKILSPVPLVPGKAVVVIKGDRSKFTVGLAIGQNSTSGAINREPLPPLRSKSPRQKRTPGLSKACRSPR